VADNADILYSEFIKIYNETQKPLVIIAHSKGAAEAILALLKYPELVRGKIVELLISINGALGGSYIASIVNGDDSILGENIITKKYFPGIFFTQ